MNKEITIAGNADIEDLVKLLTILFTQDIEFEPDYEKQKAGLMQIISNPNVGEILVMKIDNKVVGMVSLLYSISTALGGKVAILEDMVMEPEYRSQGFGKELLHEAIQLAKDRNCLRLTLLTDFDNERAQTFYRQAGFQKSKMIPMRLVFEQRTL